MKTTIDIADDLLLRAKALAREKKTTLRSLIERALFEILDEEQEKQSEIKIVTVKGKGISPEFQGKDWNQILDSIY